MYILTANDYESKSLKLLDQYARCIMDCFEYQMPGVNGYYYNPYLLNGAALAVRMSLEFMAAYLRYHYPSRKSLPFPNTGVNLINSNGKKDNYEIKAGQINMEVEGVTNESISRFIGDRNTPDSLKGLDTCVSSVLHYQHVDSKTADESKMLENEVEDIIKCFRNYKVILSDFLDKVNLLPDNSDEKAVAEFKNDYRYIKDFLAQKDDAFDSLQSASGQRVKDVSRDCPWNDFYANIILHCQNATKVDNKTDNPMIYINTLFTATRKLAERTGWIVLEKNKNSFEYNPLEKLKEQGSVTLESFLQIDDEPISDGFVDEWRTVKDYLHYAQRRTNAGMHWCNATESASLIDADSEMARAFFRCSGNVGMAISVCSFLLDTIVLSEANQPKSVRQLIGLKGQNDEELLKKADEIEELKTEITQMQEEKQKEKIGDARRLRIAIGLIIITALFCVAYIWYKCYPFPGDPNPQVSGEAIYSTQWDEMPTIDVTADGQELTEGIVNVIKTNGEVELYIEARCDGVNSLKYASDKRFANLKNFYQNDRGLAYNQYILDGDAYGISTTTGWTNDALEPGWHLLKVQAVGAGDGKVENGIELNATTGWRSYTILVLPEGEQAEWKLWNDNTNNYARSKDGLAIQEGNILIPDCNAEITKNLTLEYHWNDSEWAVVPEGGITVPKMLSGLQFLYLRANYVYDDQCALEAAFSDTFSCVFEEPEECLVDVTLETEDGVVLKDGSTLIVRPGTTCTIFANGKKGIESIEWYTQYEDDSKTDVWKEKRSEFSFAMNDAYGESSMLYITAVGKGCTGEYDSVNRKQIAIHVLYYGQEDEYDAEGRLTKEWLYEDSTTNQPTGYITYVRDDNGDIIDKAWYTADGNPTYSDDGHHRQTWAYTESETESITETWVYDLDGNTLMEGTRALGEWANGAAGRISRSVYGGDGSEEFWRYHYGTDKEPYLAKTDIAGYYQIYDSDGNCLEQYNYGLDGKPTENSNGWYHLVQEYVNGYITRKAYFNLDGDKCISADTGYHEIVWTYDEWGNVTSEIKYDSEGEAIVTNGYAKWVSTYKPDTELEVTCEYQDAAGVPVMNTALGYSRVEYEYDEKGVLTGKVYYDAGNNPVNTSEGYARYTYTRTRDRLHDVTAYYDAAGSLVIPEDRTWAKLEMYYDNDGNVCEMRYYGDETTLAKHCDDCNIATFTYKYDNDGRETEALYRDAENNLTAMSEDVNYCGMSTIYDPKDSSVTYTYYLDQNEQPILNERGFFYSKKTTDASGKNVICEERFLEGGKMLSRDQIQRIEWTYDEDGNKLSQSEYTEAREGEISQTVWTYNSEGMRESLSYYDGLGAPMEDEYGVWQYSYSEEENSNNRTIMRRKECRNALGALTIGPDGYAAVELLYSMDEVPASYGFDVKFDTDDFETDCNRMLREIRYFGTNGHEMINTKEGYAVYKLDYSNTYFSEAFYDNTGKNLLYVDEYGYAKKACDYNMYGHLIQESFYGSDGKLCVSDLYGLAVLRMEYDSENRLTSVAHYDADESLIMCPEGESYAMVNYEYKDDIKITTYYDENMNLYVVSWRGYAIEKEQYNSDGEVIWRSFYGADESLTMGHDHNHERVLHIYGYGNEMHYAEMEWTYEEGKAICRFYDQYGNLCDPDPDDILVAPVQEWTLGTDEVTCSHFDESGSLLAIDEFDLSDDFGESLNVIGFKFQYSAVRSFDADGNQIQSLEVVKSVS